MKINWKVRSNNPFWYMQLAISVLIPILAYLGINYQYITSWYAIAEIIVSAAQNPVVAVSALAAVFNSVVDPTTRGLSDPLIVMKFERPLT